MENTYHTFTNQQLVDEFNRIYKESGISRSNINRFIKNHHSNLYNEIESRTLKLNQYKKLKARKHKMVLNDISIFERIFCLMHGLDDRPLCRECGKNHVSIFNKQKNIYGEFCSQKCERHSSSCMRKGVETKRLLYGDDNITNQKKARQTRLSKFGSYHPKDFSEKVKTTKLKNHGDENYVNVEKIKHTVEQHKKENPNYYYDREQKSKQTKVANGHDPNWNNRDKFKQTISEFTDEHKQQINEKRRQTCLHDYGVESISHLDSVSAAKKQTCYQMYGVESVLQLPYVKERRRIAAKKKSWDYFQSLPHDIQPLFTEEDFISCKDGQRKLWNWKCKKCGHKFTNTWANWSSHKCPKCHPQNYHGMQDELHEYIKSICTDCTIQYDCRSVLENAKELDIYIKELATAIEFNGMFWYNSDISIYGKMPLSTMYHYDKTSECHNKGIRLIHVFEDHWCQKPALCKSKIKKILSPRSMHKIDANKCIITSTIDQKMKERFLLKYSFYGIDGSSVSYGILHNGHLVALMTFSKTRHNQQYDWQILSYAEVNSFIILDGFAKLLKAFANDHIGESICMYLSRDWNSIHDFDNIMKFERVDKPRFYWICNGVRIKGPSMTYASAKHLIDTYDDTMTLTQNMVNAGYYRVYDSGTMVFSYGI